MKNKITNVESAVQHCYSTWGETYYKEYYGEDAPYPPVHVDLLRRLILSSGSRSVLDAGCGPASFLRHLTSDSLELYGFDLTTEMVKEAKKVMANAGVISSHFWQGSVLNKDDFVQQNLISQYEAAVCFGVLPHIPARHDETVLLNLHNAVSPGGIVIVEARNALFSLFTQNRYTYQFICDELVREKDLIASAGKQGEKILKSLKDYQQHFRMDIPPIRKGKAEEPGYDEVLSRTHIPFVLREQFEKTGFRDIRIFFYHFHALPPIISKEAGDIFMKASISMENPEDWRGYFMASAFVLAGVRE